MAMDILKHFWRSLKIVAHTMVGITLTKLLICVGHSLELQLNYCGEQRSCLIKSCWRNCGVDIAARA